MWYNCLFIEHGSFDLNRWKEDMRWQNTSQLNSHLSTHAQHINIDTHAQCEIIWPLYGIVCLSFHTLFSSIKINYIISLLRKHSMKSPCATTILCHLNNQLICTDSDHQLILKCQHFFIIKSHSIISKNKHCIVLLVYHHHHHTDSSGYV